MPHPGLCRDFALSVVGFVRDCPYSDLLAVLGPEAEEQTLVYAKKEKFRLMSWPIRSLDEIKGNKLWQAGKEKEYYTRLTDTVRQYLDGEFAIPAMEQTSSETMQALVNCKEVEAKERER